MTNISCRTLPKPIAFDSVRASIFSRIPNCCETIMTINAVTVNNPRPPTLTAEIIKNKPNGDQNWPLSTVVKPVTVTADVATKNASTKGAASGPRVAAGNDNNHVNNAINVENRINVKRAGCANARSRIDSEVLRLSTRGGPSGCFKCSATASRDRHEVSDVGVEEYLVTPKR